MRIWFDTEFIEDGKTIDLMSIGMVRADGRTYYAESSECDLSRACPWVYENVMVHLTGETKTRSEIAADILDFAGQDPEFWGYFCDYDWVALCQLYGRMIDLPKGWPMFCLDIKQWSVALDGLRLPPHQGQAHHALADALWTKDAWHHLAEFSGAFPRRPSC